MALFYLKKRRLIYKAAFFIPLFILKLIMNSTDKSVDRHTRYIV